MSRSFFCVEWVKIRGYCSFSWYWWNLWQSLLKLSFLHYILLFKAPFSFGCKKILVNVLYMYIVHTIFFSFQCTKKCTLYFISVTSVLDIVEMLCFAMLETNPLVLFKYPFSPHMTWCELLASVVCP